jgi:hypothetical protein
VIRPACSFFSLPREFRDIIYDYFWTDRARIRAYYPYYETGIIAYYNSMKSKRLVSMDRHNLYRTLDIRSKDDSKPRHDIPLCVPSSKTFMSEVIEEF